METIKPRKNFNFEEDRESIDRAIEKYMADTFKVNCLIVVKKSNSSWIIVYWKIISLDTLASYEDDCIKDAKLMHFMVICFNNIDY